MKTRAGHDRRHCRTVMIKVPPISDMGIEADGRYTYEEARALYFERAREYIARELEKMPDPQVILAFEASGSVWRGYEVAVNTGEYIPLADRIKRSIGGPS